MSKPQRLLPFILLSIGGAVLYGIIHDEITARICVEYFTIGHPPVFNTDDPALLGLGWGVIATWWFGLLLGVPLSLCATRGKSPPLHWKQLVRPLGVMLLCLGIVATLAGVVGHYAATRRWVYLIGPLASTVPQESRVGFITDLWSHLASYIGGAIGAVILCRYAVMKRRNCAPL